MNVAKECQINRVCKFRQYSSPRASRKLQRVVSVAFWQEAKKKALLTSPQGLAMKVGEIPYFIPMLLATSLNKQALSAILEASVYPRAVSNTPGPVSVSANSG